MSDQPCARCGGPTPTNDNVSETMFWGFMQVKVQTVTTRSARFRATYFRRNPRRGSPLLVVDEEQPICDPCWGLLIGRFMQGRSVPAMPGKEGR